MEQPSWIKRTLGGRYLIEALIGQGGMSAVYKASDPNLKRVIAIKLIHSHLASDTNFILRFEEEAAAVAKLRHPNIVQVFDFNSDEGVYYMVLEFIPGETLQERMSRLRKDRRQFPIEEAIKFTINICDAMGYAHKQGIIHRDIKPANIMLDIHGQAILMDFGIVKIIGGVSHTATGAVVGTARYMSPETIRSEVPDQRSDIYSLGITLYEMLNGEPPFNADSAMSLMMMHLNDPVPELHAIKPDMPPELANILHKSLEKDAVRRYSSASEMAADLKRVLATLDRKNAASVSTVPDAAVPEAHQTETQVDAPALDYESDEDAADQKADDATTAEPQKAGSAATKVDSAVPAKAMQAPVPVRPAQTAADESPPPQTQDKRASKIPRLPLLLGLGGGGIILIIIVIAGIFGLGNIFNPEIAAVVSNTPEGSQQATTTQLALNPATEIPTLTLTPTVESTPTLESTPTNVPTVTNTLPPLYVQINNISTNAANQYVVDYETFGYTESLPGMHIHFFFDTVNPDQAGVPGSGPWILYGGPRPFTEYGSSQKPGSATQMCALVANANHSVIQESGNCFDLP